MTPPDEFALALTEVNYRYRSDWLLKPTHAISDLSLEVRRGESFGFLGHNGAGKTTTIKCILGLIRPTSGTISIFGKNNHELESRRSVGYLPEQPYFYDHLTVQEIMELYATLAGVPRAGISRAVARALDLVRVSARSRSPMRSLSKGLTQRVGMAQAIVAQPQLLILDEPFSGLDPIGRKEFKELLVHLKSEGATIFMSSHILGDVEFLCDRVSIMAHGTLKGVFEVQQIPQLAGGSYELVVRDTAAVRELLIELCEECHDQQKFVRFVFSSRENAERALRAALNEQAEVESFQFVHGDLEDLFVQLVGFDEGGREQQ